jgi:hypothetical protein
VTGDDGEGPIDEIAVKASLQRLDALAAAHPELVGPTGPDNLEVWAALLAADEKGQTDMASESTTQVAFRFPDGLVARIDRHVERMKVATPGIDFSRADAVRSLLTRVLDEVEADAPAAKSPRPAKRRG